MLTVMFAGDPGAAIGGGALMAWTLAKPRANLIKENLCNPSFMLRI
jgi:hypothetical protein